MIKINECIINKVAPLKHWSLSITLLIKKEDYTNEDRIKLEEMWSEWTSLVWVLQDFWEKNEDNKPKLRQRLAILMSDYSKASWLKENELLEWLYKTYNVKSRTDLNEEQLKTEIDKYEAWIKALEYWFN